MMPLYEDSWFTFRFADDRIIDRIHLDGIAGGRSVTLYSIDPTSGVRLAILATATTDADGWVQLPRPLIVRAGDAFMAVPDELGAPVAPVTPRGAGGEGGSIPREGSE